MNVCVCVCVGKCWTALAQHPPAASSCDERAIHQSWRSGRRCGGEGDSDKGEREGYRDREEHNDRDREEHNGPWDQRYVFVICHISLGFRI